MPMPFLTPGALALAAALATAPARPAGTTVSYAERYAAQKSFAEEYAKSHPATVAKPADLDRFYARLEAAWAKSLGPRTDPALARLDPQIYVTAMLAVTARKEPDWARCHLWSQHSLPAFYADLETLRAKPSAERAALLQPIHIVHVLAYPMSICDLPRPEWDRFRAALAELPRVLDTYLDRRGPVAAQLDPGTVKTLRRFRDFAREQGPILAVRDALYRNDLARARQELGKGFAEGAARLDLAEAGHRLADLHRARGQVDEALSLLDLIARSTAAMDVPDETLREWYAGADPHRGPQRYAKAATARLPALVPTDERIRLAGRYVDLTTGRPLDLASLAGKTVLLDFWATWCTICLAEVPKLNALAERHGRDGKFVVVGVSSDALTGSKPPESAVRDLAQRKGMRYLVVYDRPEGSLTESFQVEAWPTHVLIGGDGRVLAPPGTVKRKPRLEDIEAYLDSRRPAGGAR